MKINFDGRYYEIDTQFPKKLKEDNYYYLADDYKNPTKVKFLEYAIAPSTNNRIVIMPRVLNLATNEFEYYFTKRLFNSKSKASDYYLFNKQKK